MHDVSPLHIVLLSLRNKGSGFLKLHFAVSEGKNVITLIKVTIILHG